MKLVLEDDKLPITITIYLATFFLAGETDTVATSCVLQDKFGCIIYFNICKYENRYFIYILMFVKMKINITCFNV